MLRIADMGLTAASQAMARNQMPRWAWFELFLGWLGSEGFRVLCVYGFRAYRVWGLGFRALRCSGLGAQRFPSCSQTVAPWVRIA